MENNPYRAPIFSDPPAIGVSSLSEAEIRAFVGRNAGYYLRKWPVALEDRGPARGFNWAAFLLSGFWIPYRKMYRLTLIVYSVMGVMTFLAAALESAGPVGDRALALNRVFEIGFAIVCGIFGNAWYLAHARREIARARASGLEGPAYYEALARRGGTNFLAAIGLFVLFVAVIALVTFVLVLIDALPKLGG